MKLIDQLYGWFLKAANFLQSPLLLVIRLYWGFRFWETGYGKLTHISVAIENFTNWHVPAPAFTAHFIGWLEAVGGILLFFGLASRLIALPLTINLIVAFALTEREALSTVFSDDPSNFYAAAPYTFLFASLLILVFGPGKISLDTLIAWYRARNKAAAAGTAAAK